MNTAYRLLFALSTISSSDHNQVLVLVVMLCLLPPPLIE
jgi:hypothetical protein